MPISLPQEASLAAHRLPPTNDPRVHPADPGRPRVELALPNHLPTTARSNRRLGWPSFEHEAPTQADHQPGMDAAGDHADPAIPAVRLPAHAALQDLTSAGHRARGNAQTPDADTGRRTANTWTLRRPHRTLDSGPVDRQAWTLAARTGHRTPDAGRGRGQGDDGAAGIRTSWATTPSDRTLGRPTVFLWTAPAALDSPCRLGGEAAFQREIASRRQLLGRSAGVERRLGALLSSDEFRVERRANGDASSVMQSR
jgi:hypothetical protein